MRELPEAATIKKKVYHRAIKTSEYAVKRMSAGERQLFEETREYQAQFKPEGKNVRCLALDCDKVFFSPDPRRIRFCSSHRESIPNLPCTYRIHMRSRTSS